jgi:hypothetical protein
MKYKIPQFRSVQEAVKATVGASRMSRSGVQIRLKGQFTETEINNAIGNVLSQVRIRIIRD